MSKWDEDEKAWVYDEKATIIQKREEMKGCSRCRCHVISVQDQGDRYVAACAHCGSGWGLEK